jgi:hypothetical protein
MGVKLRAERGARASAQVLEVTIESPRIDA